MNQHSQEQRATTPKAAPDHADVLCRPPLLLFGLVIVGVVCDLVVPLPFVPASVPEVWVGGGLWLAGFALAALAVWQMLRAGTDVQTHTSTSRVVEGGVFAHSRNPIYLGGLIGLLGVGIGFNSLWLLVMLPLFYLVVRYGVVAREEAYLERKFGADYLVYKARVRRWL